MGQLFFFELGDTTMAKRKINRSQAIRDYLSSNPDATPKTIIEELAKKKIKVSAALVSAVKYNKATPAKGRKKRGRPVGTSANGRHVDFDNLVLAKNLATKMGGVQKA